MPTGRSVHDLIGDYLEVLGRGARQGPSPRGKSPAGLLPSELDNRLRAYHCFIVRQTHHVLRDPALLFPLAIAQPMDSLVRTDALALEAAGKGPTAPWFCALHPPPTDPNPALVRVLEGHTGSVHSVAMSGDGLTAISGSRDHTVRVWDLGTGRCSAVLQGHTHDVESVGLSVDGRKAISGSSDGTVRVWDLSTGQCSAVLQGHTDRVTSVGLSVDGRTAISGGVDETVRVWDLSSGGCTAVLEGHTDRVTSVGLSVDGRTVISGSVDETVRVWDLSSGGCTAVLEGHTNGVSSVAMSVDGRTAISGSRDQAISGKSRDQTVRVWDLGTGQCTAVLDGHTGGVESVALSGDGRTALSGSDDRTVCFWDLTDGRCLLVFPCDESVKSLVLTPRPPSILGVGDCACNVLFFRIETESTRSGAGTSGPARRGTR